jgi:anti-sigma B factor antagonist
MNIETVKKNNAIVLELEGRFDAHEVPGVKEALTRAIDITGNVVVDLKQVNFIDSAALATLVQGMKHCRQAQGDLYICNLQQPVRIIFELTRLDKAFKLYDSRDAALASI